MGFSEPLVYTRPGGKKSLSLEGKREALQGHGRGTWQGRDAIPEEGPGGSWRFFIEKLIYDGGF